MNVEKPEQQNKQGIIERLVENYNCYLGLCYCGKPCLWNAPTEDDSESEIQSENLKQLLIKQAQKTRKETLEEAIDLLRRWNDPYTKVIDKLINELQSLINKQ